MKDNDKTSRKRKGIIIAAAVHVTAIILFFILGFDVVDPKKGTVEVTWEMHGEPDQGGENPNQPTAENPSDKPAEEAAASASSEAVDEQEIASDQSSAVAVKSTPVKTIKKKTPKTVTVKKDPQKTENETETDAENKKSDALAAAQAAYLKGQNDPGGIGDGPKKGTQGSETSNGDDKSGKNGGGGNGKYDISGRKATNIGSQKNGCGQKGTVEVKIIVNRAGVVINAIATGGTTTNSCLQNQAIQFAKKIKYAPKTSGPKTNEGKITIKYKVS